MNYLALLGGINVGGKSVIRMTDLRDCLEAAGFTGVRTFIQSGNVLFTGPKRPTAKLALELEKPIEQKFRMQVGVTVFTAAEWEEVVRGGPKWWGREKEWKHNLLALLPGARPDEVMAAAGNLKPEIEMLAPGPGVVYQSLSLQFYGRVTSGKLASHPIYRRFTVRNHNTTLRLAELLRDDLTW